MYLHFSGIQSSDVRFVRLFNPVPDWHLADWFSQQQPVLRQQVQLPLSLLLFSSSTRQPPCYRYMYAAARQGHLPAAFSCVNKENESPRVAVFAQVNSVLEQVSTFFRFARDFAFLQTALAFGISFVGDLDALVGYVMFGFWAQRVFTLIALLIIRHNQIPVHPEAIRMPLPLLAFAQLLM